MRYTADAILGATLIATLTRSPAGGNTTTPELQEALVDQVVRRITTH